MATDATNLNGDKLAELIAHRHACLSQLHKLGLKQCELVSTGEVGGLLRLLSVKNQLIAALQTIEQQLAPFHAQEPDQRIWSSTAAREQCAKQVAECQALLEEIMQMERDNEQKMTERRDRVASQLQAVQSSGIARRAYQAHQRVAPHVPAPAVTQGAAAVNLHAEA